MDRLYMISPINVLKRGYSLTYNINGTPLVSIGQTAIGDNIKVTLKDGELTATVKNVHTNGEL